MNTWRHRVLICLYGLIACSLTFPMQAQNNEMTQIQFKNYSKFLNDVSDRRSRIVYTPYPISYEHGLQQGLVHVSTGAVAFARTDLVVDSPMPIVVRRVYNSQRDAAGDFGVGGWTLSFLETIEESAKNTWLYTYGNGRKIQFTGKTPTMSAIDQVMSDVMNLSVASNTARLTTRTGLTKTFKRLGSLFRLVQVKDAFGNQMDVVYDDRHRITSLQNTSGAAVEFHRDDAGRIVTVADHLDREIHYQYDDNGQLAGQRDLRGETWNYRYHPNRLLNQAITPNGLVDVALTYNTQGQAMTSAINGFVYRFDYEGAQTIVDDDVGSTTYQHNDNGMTVSVINVVGTQTILSTDTLGRPQMLKRNDEVVARVAYQSTSNTAQPVLLKGKLEGVRFDVSFDNKGRIIRQSQGDTHRFSVKRYGAGLTPHVVQVGKNRLWLERDDQGEFTRIDEVDGHRWIFSRDDNTWNISNDLGDATLQFNRQGALVSASTDDDDSITFDYDAGGFRTKTVASTGEHTTYHYDASGSLIYTEVWLDDGPKEGFYYKPNEFNVVTEIETTKGRVIKMIYGDNGLPHHFQSAEFVDLVFHYDGLGRLTSIDRDGYDSIAYQYSPGEADIVLQHDTRSVTPFSQHRDPLEFGTRFETTMSRIVPTDLGVFGFSPSTKELVIPFDVNAWTPITPISHSINAMQLGALIDDQPDFAEFSVPSSRLFIPSEIWSVNCCWCGCILLENPLTCAIP